MRSSTRSRRLAALAFYLSVWLAAPASARIVTTVVTGGYIGQSKDLALDSAENAFVGGGSIFGKAIKVEPAGTITEILDMQDYGVTPYSNDVLSLAVDDDGNVWVGTASQLYPLFKVEPNGTATAVIDGFDADGLGNELPAGTDVAVDATGNVYVTGGTNAFKRTPGGTVTLLIDASGDGAGHALAAASAIAVDGSGNVYVAGYDSVNVFKIEPGGAITQILDATGDGAGHPLARPQSLAVSAAGDVYVGDRWEGRVFRVAPGGAISVPIDTAGDGQGHVLDEPRRIALGPDGTLWVADFGDPFIGLGTSGEIFRVDPDGGISTVLDASGDGADEALNRAWGIDVAADGTVYASDVSQMFRIEFTCPATPAVGCRAPVTPLKSTLVMKDPARLVWRWTNGAATTLGELGDPETTTDYSLCMYDESGGGSDLLLELTAPGGRQCLNGPCWSAIPSGGFSYKNSESLPDGLRSLKVFAGEDGAAKVSLKAKGDDLALPPLSPPLPLRVQVQASNAECFEAVFDTPGVLRDDGIVFKAKGGAP
jgi:sugar lactone lactonase YvrE